MIMVVLSTACSEPPPSELHGKTGQHDGMEVLWLWGTPEEMGYAEGGLLCGRITGVLESEYLSHPLVALLGYENVIRQLEETAAVPAEAEAQLRAMIDGMHDRCSADDLLVESDALSDGFRLITFEDLLLINYSNVLLDEIACSSLTVWGEAAASGATLHARNLDSKALSATKIDALLIKVYRRSGPNAATWASINLPGRIGCVTCFDPRGAGVTNHNADRSAREGSDASGLASIEDTSLAALLAAGAASDPAAAAESVYDAAPRRAGNNVHLFLPCHDGDCAGGLVFENDGDDSHPDGRATARHPGDVDDGLMTDAGVVCTNHFVERAETSLASPGSLERYAILVDGINQAVTFGEGLDASGAAQLMADVSAPEISSPTFYTVILDTSTRLLYLHLAASAEADAPLQAPHVLSLDDLFAVHR